jgi:hypothetical protein
MLFTYIPYLKRYSFAETAYPLALLMTLYAGPPFLNMSRTSCARSSGTSVAAKWPPRACRRWKTRSIEWLTQLLRRQPGGYTQRSEADTHDTGLGESSRGNRLIPAGTLRAAGSSAATTSPASVAS